MFGVIVPDTNFSERSVLAFDELNKSVKEMGEYCLFYANLSAQVKHADFAIMNITEINHAYGWILMATCPSTADILKKVPINATKAYYIMDLGFLMKPYDFNEMHKCLSGLVLITRSEEHQKIIRNIFNLGSIVLPFDLGIICNTLS